MNQISHWLLKLYQFLRLSVFSEPPTMSVILGDDTMALSAASISKLIKVRERDLEQFKRRRINKKYVYLWADGVHVTVRLGDDKKACILVAFGVTETGEKELLAAEGGFRESKDYWLAVLLKQWLLNFYRNVKRGG